jgi:hypothetical protein
MRSEVPPGSDTPELLMLSVIVGIAVLLAFFHTLTVAVSFALTAM